MCIQIIHMLCQQLVQLACIIPIFNWAYISMYVHLVLMTNITSVCWDMKLDFEAFLPTQVLKKTNHVIIMYTNQHVG